MGGYVKVWAIGKTMLHATAASAKMAVRLAPALLLSAWTASYFFGLEIYPVTARSSPWAVYFERGEICLTSLLENRRKISEFGSGYYYIEINLASAASTRKDEILYALSARTESGGKIWAFAGFLFVGSNITMLSRITEFRVEICLAKRTTSGGSYQPRLDRSQCRFPRHTGSFFLSAGGSAAQTGRPRTIAPGGGGILSMTGLRNGQSPNRFYHAGKIVQWQNDLGSIAHNAWRLVEL